jgi:hypothetical protein
MTNPEAREYNLKIIADAAKQTPGISISSQHFADQGFCTCPRCIKEQAKSGLSWVEWRAKVVTEFLADVKEVVQSKPLFVNCLPDPLLGKVRFGYDFEAMAQYADYFVIPMFSKAYPTPWYWETIARGKAWTALSSSLRKPITSESSRRNASPTKKNVSSSKTTTATKYWNSLTAGKNSKLFLSFSSLLLFYMK